jgi:hypothetical protein
LNKSIAFKIIFASVSAGVLYFALFIGSIFYEEAFKPQWQQEYENAQYLEGTDAQQAITAYANSNIVASAQNAPLSFRLNVIDKLGNLQVSKKKFNDAFATFDSGATVAHGKDQERESQFICERENIFHAYYTDNFNAAQTSEKWKSLISSCLANQKVPLHFAPFAKLTLANLYSDDAQYKEADLWFEKSLASDINLESDNARREFSLAFDSSKMLSLLRRKEYTSGTKILVDQIRENTPIAQALKALYEDYTSQIDDDVTGNGDLRNKRVSLLEKKQFKQLDALYQNNLASKKQTVGGFTYLEQFTSGLRGFGDEASEKDWTERLALLEEWRTQMPNSDAAKLVLADFYFHYGFHARGHGGSYRVSALGWKLLRARLDQAEKNLNLVKVKSPLWYSISQDVAMAQEWEEDRYDALFQEGRRKFPDSHTIISTKMVWLAPMWYGKPGDADAYLLTECAKLNEEQGAILYAELTADWLNEGKTSLEQTNKLSYDLFKNGMRAAFKQPCNQNWIEGRARLALFALSRKDYATALSAFD